MRIACALAIALVLSLTAAGQPPPQHDPAGSANSAAQSPAVASKAPESVPHKKTDAGSASRVVKAPKRAEVTPDGAPRKIVVRQGGASEPAAQIAPGITPAEAARERQNAEQLLGAAGGQLKLLALRTLDARQQETVGQVRNYMDGARSALQQGDVRKASTLAQKAHLLAEDLVQH
jgi:hypothetical protein